MLALCVCFFRMPVRCDFLPAMGEGGFAWKGWIVRRLGIVIVVAVIIMVLASPVAYIAAKRAAAARSRPVIVRLEAVHTGELVEFVSAPGEIEPRTNVEITFGAGSAGLEGPRKPSPFGPGPPGRSGGADRGGESPHRRAKGQSRRHRRLTRSGPDRSGTPETASRNARHQPGGVRPGPACTGRPASAVRGGPARP